ncbi:lysoplasmalogenase [Nocardioides montaniterrae]
MLAVLTGVVAIADWVSVVKERKDLETWLKPATLALMTITVIAAGALDHRAGVWLVIALLLGLLGDIALLDDTVESRFKAGLAAFLVGHLAYVVCFVALPGTLEVLGGYWVWGGMGVIALALSVGNGVLPATFKQGGIALAVPVAAYMSVITAMTLAAWLTADWWIAIGASIFVASDSILSINKFVRPLGRAARPAIMVTYHVGQALIAVGVLRLVARY